MNNERKTDYDQYCQNIFFEELKEYVTKALSRNYVSSTNSEHVAKALLWAEADGLESHGLARLQSYIEQARSGKLNGYAVPQIVYPNTATILVDAQHGFAYPAIEAGLQEMINLCPQTGTCALAITRSHHSGALGHAVEKLARNGLVGIGFTNTPAAIAPWKGNKPLFGTNPVAFSCPSDRKDPLLIDLSLSEVARGKIFLAKQRGEDIPEGWALDAEGRQTTDPDEALKGSMVPIGGAKGANLALMVEIMTACLTGANFGFESSSFFNPQGPPPGVGQFFIAFHTDAFVEKVFRPRIQSLLSEMEKQSETRIPGSKRFEKRRKTLSTGFTVNSKTYSWLFD